MATVAISNTSITVLRVSIGIIFLWFGALKGIHGYSPAEDLAINTINKLTFGLLPPDVNLMLLAIWEVLLGLFLIAGFWLRPMLILLLIHMVCTFTPLLFFPEVSFKFAPYGFTLVGQYIMKNIVIICAAWVIWQQAAHDNQVIK